MTARILAIDPGIRGCGVSLWLDDVLVRAAYIRNAARKGNGPDECVSMAQAIKNEEPAFFQFDVMLVLEYPQAYRTGLQKGDQNDLFTLACVDGALAALTSGPVVHYLPAQWKGQVDADTMITRIQGRLTPDETARVRLAGALSHNVWDAVGLGLHHLGRLKPKKVYAP